MTLDDLRARLRDTQTISVTDALTVPAISAVFTGVADMPPVFVTAFMGALRNRIP